MHNCKVQSWPGKAGGESCHVNAWVGISAALRRVRLSSEAEVINANVAINEFAFQIQSA